MLKYKSDVVIYFRVSILAAMFRIRWRWHIVEDGSPDNSELQ